MMADYIDRQLAEKTIGDNWNKYVPMELDINLAFVLAKLDELPSADVVEVVRCGECKHMTEDGRCLEFADDCLRPSVSDYCSYGERKA